MIVPASAGPPASASAQLIRQLGNICQDRGLPELASRLLGLQGWVQAELRDFEAALETVPRGARVVQHAARHLLDLDGKHLRPMCVVLASKLGAGFGEGARQLAVAVELVHTATLLHDDVVDVSDTRRGVDTARVVYGNAASIFAGDWLLVESLRRIRRAEVPGLLDLMLAIIEQMILAESLQLERRGRLADDEEEYFRVVEGKTASLFRWAMYAGGRAGGLDEEACTALERYGADLGVAFQAVDDLLDFDGDSDLTGKDLFADLREGKTTYPLLLALRRDPTLRGRVEAALDDGGGRLPEHVARAAMASMEATGALADCRKLAQARVRRAIDSLAPIPDGPGKSALITVAEATVYRER
ncbi:polyprenyl synthetase family protein [Haliangium sp.]|uniref:polyprenyl synthetase family protein n=1 Tax=Haliangium sp. TaxID=2663208 RepID=UPI003D140BBE